MPVVPITSSEQYEKAIEVLDRVGGTYQGVGYKEWFLIVTEAQYKALVEAGVASQDSGKDSKRGKNRGRPAPLEEMLQHLRDAFAARLFPPLGGYVYRFTIFLPLLSEGREVFSIAQRRLLKQLFHACFGGYTEAAAEGHPPVSGSWMPPGTTLPIVDSHTLMAVYTPQIEEAKDFFRQLRWILEQKHVADQEVVLSEHTSVWLVEPSPLLGT